MNESFFLKFKKLSSEIHVPADEYNDDYNLFSFYYYINGLIEIKDQLFEELESELFRVGEGKEQFFIDNLRKKFEQVFKEDHIVSKERIEDWFLEYEMEYRDINSILNLNQDTSLYEDLRLNDSDNKFISNEKIYNLHIDFISFVKRELSRNLLSKLESIYRDEIVQKNDLITDIDESENRLWPFKNEKRLIEFQTYVESFIVDKYNDYSYLFQRLKEDKFIEPIKHKEFMKWIKEKNYISDEVYQNFFEKNSFYTLQKSFSAQRENNFNNTFRI